MSYVVIWIDQAHAKFFQLSQEKMERKTLEHPCFWEVAEEISSNSQILILGPGLMKDQLQKFLNSHHPHLSKKVVACETLDYPADPLIAAQALKHFKI